MEESLEYLNEDEYCEVTPESIRLRKKILNKNEREKSAKRKNLQRFKLKMTKKGDVLSSFFMYLKYEQ